MINSTGKFCPSFSRVINVVLAESFASERQRDYFSLIRFVECWSALLTCTPKIR